MKYAIFVADGMYDYPIESLGDKTPLQVADTPHFEELVKKSVCGRLKTIPDGLTPDSAVANLSILGYDPRVYFTGRGVLEAANMGVPLEKNDVAFRCNLIATENEKVLNHSADNISSAEGRELIKTLNKELGSDEVRFYPGVSYRNLLVFRRRYSDKVTCFPPHDNLGKKLSDILPRADEPGAKETERKLRELIRASRDILAAHPVNKKRVAEGKKPATFIWPWSPGRKAPFKTFKEQFGVSGAVISAVDLINGIGVYAGFDVIKVEGATGLINTNYEGKADAAVAALDTHDFVYVHVEASDEAGHEGNIADKIKAIEYFDKRLLGRFLQKNKHKVNIAILADHYTPIALRTHARDPVPFMIYNGKEADDIALFDEESLSTGSLGLMDAESFIRYFLNKA